MRPQVLLLVAVGAALVITVAVTKSWLEPGAEEASRHARHGLGGSNDNTRRVPVGDGRAGRLDDTGPLTNDLLDEFLHSRHHLNTRHEEHTAHGESMRMVLSTGTDVVLFFDWWRSESPIGFSLSVAMAAVMGFCEGTLQRRAMIPLQKSPALPRRLLDCGLHAVRITLNMLIMLAAMTFNVGVIGGIVFGSGVAFYFQDQSR